MIIGLSGKIGCGKSFLTNLFLKDHPEYTKLSFAGILKKECSEKFEYPDRRCPKIFDYNENIN